MQVELPPRVPPSRAAAPAAGSGTGAATPDAGAPGSEEDMMVDMIQPQQQHESKAERCRRLSAEIAARAGNGWAAARMIRARLLHLAILRLLGAPLRLPPQRRPSCALVTGSLRPCLAAAGLLRQQLPEH